MKFLTTTGKYKPVRNYQKFKIIWNGKSRSKFQKNVKRLLYQHWRHDLVFEEFKVAGTKLSLDFYNHSEKIAIEVQGEQHQQFIPHFHRTRANFVRQIRRDDKKYDFCKANKIRLLYIYPDDELNEEFITELLSD